MFPRCNLKCVWCHREEEDIKSCGYLEHDIDYEKLVKFLPQTTGIETIHWGGLGEPFMYKNIYSLSDVARKYVDNVKVTTNGTAFSRSVVNKIRDSGINQLEVSIDGFDGGVNKLFRGSDEEIIIENIEYLSTVSDIPIQINSVAADVNYDSLFMLVDKLRGIKNIKSIHIIPLFMTEYMRRNNVGVISNDQFKTLLRHLEERADSHGLEWEFKPSSVEIDVDIVRFVKKTHNICFTPYEDPFINVFGDLVPCPRLQHYRSFGNVFEKPLADIWNGAGMREWRRSQLGGNYNSDCQRECGMLGSAD